MKWKVEVEKENLKGRRMREYRQDVKQELCNILETNHQINAKPTEPFIHTIIKLMVERRICDGQNSLNNM